VALAVDYLIGNVHQPQPVSGGPAKVPSLYIESVEHEQTHSKRTFFHLELFASQRKCQFYLNTINQDGNQQHRGKRETRNPFTLTCYSFAPLCELRQATMPPLAVPPDVICSHRQSPQFTGKRLTSLAKPETLRCHGRFRGKRRLQSQSSQNRLL
jgi:hypothetical protein